MGMKEKLIQIAENEQKVYEAGQRSMIDESKIIEKTVSGSIITLDDVSEIPHEVSVQLSSDTVTDFSGVVVNAFEKHLNNKSNVASTNSAKNPLTIINDTTYILSPDASEGKMFGVFFKNLNLQVGDIINCSVKNVTKTGRHYGWRLSYTDGTNGTLSYNFNITLTIDKPVKYLQLYCDLGNADFSYESVTFTDVCVFKESEATKCIADINGNAKVKSISPYMTISTDTSDINITVTYHKSWGM